MPANHQLKWVARTDRLKPVLFPAFVRVCTLMVDPANAR